jgi:hypothetical protein
MEGLTGSVVACGAACLQRKHNLASQPPQPVLVSAEAVKGESRQNGQAQDSVTGNSASARALKSHCDIGPASNPIRLKW